VTLFASTAWAAASNVITHPPTARAVSAASKVLTAMAKQNEPAMTNSAKARQYPRIGRLFQEHDIESPSKNKVTHDVAACNIYY
jgi:hypothetical protein